jgi:hypothetical protein
VASVQVADPRLGSILLVSGRSSHLAVSCVTVRTKIIYLVKVSGVLDFDAKARRAIVLNGGSGVSGLADVHPET